MMDKIEHLLRSEIWNGVSGIITLLTAAITIYVSIKSRLATVVKNNGKLIVIVAIYLVSTLCLQYLFAKPSMHYLFVLIIWWFLFLIIVYVVNQLISYPELFVKGFQDDFRNGLLTRDWEYYGDWRVIKEPNGNILQVSNSDAGGISTKCKMWTNYDFSFDTKIIKHNSSWIIRPTDVFSYVMLQCKTNEIIPHYRVQGNWMAPETFNFPFGISLNEWFHVKIEVRNIRVVVKIVYRNETHTVLDRDLLQPQVLPIIPVTDKENSAVTRIKWACSYPHGSIGFRQYGDEIAHFRNVKVFKV